MSQGSGGEVRKSFHHQLDVLHDDLVRLAALVTETIPRGTQALLDGDTVVCQALIDADDQLDDMAIDLEERCYQLLALQQPMARDLRQLVTAIRAASEYERSGDLVVNIAKGSGRLGSPPEEPRVRGLLQQMSDEAVALMRGSIEAYADADALKAADLDERDDVLDDLHREYIAAVLESCQAGRIEIQAAVQLALVGRYYERIGDHAVNVGERVLYMVSGWMPEHHHRSRPDAGEPVA
jgi:phosphate transport system protein